MKKFLAQIKNLKPDFKTIGWGMILTLVFFSVISLTVKNYQTTITILVATKSDSASQNLDKIVANLTELPKTSSFYERLLSDNSDIKENKPGFSMAERMERWNEMIRVKNSPKNSSLIKITIFANNEKDAVKIASKSVRTLFDMASSIYNVKTDLDLRVVDGPITKSTNKTWPLTLAISALLGFLLSYILQNTLKPFANGIVAIANMVKLKIQETKTKNILEDKVEEIFPPQYNEDEVAETTETASEVLPQPEQEDEMKKRQDDEELERLNKIIQQDIYPNFPEMPVSSVKTSGAPDNLPIADSSFFMEENPISEVRTESEQLEVENKTEEDLNREPTPEELKKRLNQLLKGKL